MRERILISLALAAAAIACGPQAQADRPSLEWSARSEQLAAGPAGSIPAGLPSHLAIGLFEQNNGTWMSGSGVPWDVRYEYLTRGWSNNWGWGARDGSFALSFMQQADAARMIPSFTYYQMNGEPGGSEAQFLAKLGNAGTMNDYFTDVKLLFQRAKDFGKPVIVHLEPDGFGFLEQQSQDNPNAYAAVAASGLPELAGLPDTVAGWGLAFLQLRRATGAGNVVLAVHVSSWASGVEFATHSVADPLQPIVDKVYSFLKPMGLGTNQTGATFDLLAGDPLDRDADFYRLTQGSNPWWNASDSASIASASFNRYGEWLRLWNQSAAKRWMLWQIPIGNSNQLNVYNNGNPREGYQDNRAEYFFANGKAHAQKFADAGVIALLFGAGAGGQSSYTNDVFSDGQLFLKSRVGQFYAAGGLQLGAGVPPADGGTGSDAGPGSDAGTGSDAGSDAGTGSDAGAGSDAGTGSDGGTGSPGVQYGFESGLQGWTRTAGMITLVSTTTSRAYAGKRSLAVSFKGTSAGSQRALVRSPSAGPGSTVSFHLWIPAGSKLSSVQPYALQNAAGNWAWTGSWRAVSTLRTGAWNTILLQVPANAAPLFELGVEFSTSAAWTGTAYLDSVGW